MPSKQRGGKVLGKGGYGCVIEPAKMCSAKMNTKNKVSKLINMSGMNKDEIDELNEEYKIGQKFKKVDKNNKYFLGGVDKCKIKSSEIKKSDLKKCEFTTKREVELLNIVMKKGKDFEKVVPKLSDDDILKSIAHLLKGAKKAISLNMLLLDIKSLNILFVNSEEEFKDKKGKKINKIHPVFIDFGPTLIAQNKKQLKSFIKDMGPQYYPSWPLEILVSLYFTEMKSPIRKIKNWQEHFDTEKHMIDVMKSNKKMDLDEYAEQVKRFNGVDIKKNKKQMEKLYKEFMSDINSNFKKIMEKILVYEIAYSYGHIAAQKPKIMKVIEPMLYPDYGARSTISQALKRIKKEIGSIEDKDLLITYKKLNIFQKFHKFMTKPRGGGIIKKY